jgi:hypothetical protein
MITGSAGKPLQAGCKGPLNAETAIHVIQQKPRRYGGGFGREI